MTLEEYVLTYKGTTDTGEDGIVCNIPDYYERYIKPLDKRFENYSFYASRTVLCPLHDDNDPSLGLISHRFYDGVKIYHCFGCGMSGTIIRLHQLIQDMYHGNKMTDEEACKDLASLFGVSLDDFTELAEDDYEGRYLQKLKKIDKLKDAYTLNDFSRALLDARKSGGKDILGVLHMESIKLIATKKKLYS